MGGRKMKKGDLAVMVYETDDGTVAELRTTDGWVWMVTEDEGGGLVIETAQPDECARLSSYFHNGGTQLHVEVLEGG